MDDIYDSVIFLSAKEEGERRDTVTVTSVMLSFRRGVPLAVRQSPPRSNRCCSILTADDFSRTRSTDLGRPDTLIAGVTCTRICKHLHLDLERLLNILEADARAFLWRSPGRRVQLYCQPTLPPDLV